MAWVNVTARAGAGPSPRSFHSVTLVGGQAYVIGGSSPDGLLGDVHVLRIEPDGTQPRWDEVDLRLSGSRNELTPRARHSAVHVDGKIFVFGGIGGGDSVFALDTRKRRWMRLKTIGNGPCARFGHCAVAIHDSMYIVGGHSGSALLNDVFRLCTTTRRWYQVSVVSATPLPPRLNYTACRVGEDIVLFGGEVGAPVDSLWQLRRPQRAASRAYADAGNKYEWLSIPLGAEAKGPVRAPGVNSAAPRMPLSTVCNACFASEVSVGQVALGSTAARLFFLGSSLGDLAVMSSQGALDPPNTAIWYVDVPLDNLGCMAKRARSEDEFRWHHLQLAGDMPPARFGSALCVLDAAASRFRLLAIGGTISPFDVLSEAARSVQAEFETPSLVRHRLRSASSSAGQLQEAWPPSEEAARAEAAVAAAALRGPRFASFDYGMDSDSDLEELDGAAAGGGSVAEVGVGGGPVAGKGGSEDAAAANDDDDDDDDDGDDDPREFDEFDDKDEFDDPDRVYGQDLRDTRRLLVDELITDEWRRHQYLRGAIRASDQHRLLERSTRDLLHSDDLDSSDKYFSCGVHILDTNAFVRWERIQVETPPPEPRSGLTLTCLGVAMGVERFLVLGGDGPSGVARDAHLLEHQLPAVDCFDDDDDQPGGAGRWSWLVPSIDVVTPRPDDSAPGRRSRVGSGGVSRAVEHEDIASSQSSPPIGASLPALSAHTATFFGGAVNKVFVFGGGDLESVSDSLWVLHMDEPDLWYWERASPAPVLGQELLHWPGARAGHAAVPYFGHLIVVGGGGAGGKMLSDAWKINIREPLRRADDASAVDEEGEGESEGGTGEERALYQGVRWTRMRTAGSDFKPRLGHSCTAVDSLRRIFAFGGCLSDSGSSVVESTRNSASGASGGAGLKLQLSDGLYNLRPGEKPARWRPLNDLCCGTPPTPRYCHAATRVGRPPVPGMGPGHSSFADSLQLCIYGGLGYPRDSAWADPSAQVAPQPLHDIYILNLRTLTWTAPRTDPASLTPRWRLGLCKTAADPQQVLLFGGCSDSAAVDTIHTNVVSRTFAPASSSS